MNIAQFLKATKSQLSKIWVLRGYVLLTSSPPPRRAIVNPITPQLQPQDAIDFTDNDIQQLGNFPLSERLHTLLLARNRIATIQPTLANSLPNLTVLILTANNLSELGDLEPLGKFKRLVHLSLLENPVVRKDVSSP